MSVIKSKHLDEKKISFAEPFFFDKTKNACLINILYDKKPLYLQTPRLLCKFGLNGFKDEKTDIVKSYTVSLQFNSEADSINRVDNFQKKMKSFDKLVFDNVLKNTKKWLNYPKKLPKEALKTFFKKSLYYKILPTDEIDYSVPPTFKVKLPFKNNQLNNLYILNTDNKSIDFDINYLEENFIDGAIIKSIVEPNIWIREKQVGITYNVKALLIYPHKIQKKTLKSKKSENTKPIDNYFNNKSKEHDSSSDSDDNNDDDDDLENIIN